MSSTTAQPLSCQKVGTFQRQSIHPSGNGKDRSLTFSKCHVPVVSDPGSFPLLRRCSPRRIRRSLSSLNTHINPKLHQTSSSKLLASKHSRTPQLMTVLKLTGERSELIRNTPIRSYVVMTFEIVYKLVNRAHSARQYHLFERYNTASKSLNIP